jgi:hypothetical protein
MRRHYYAVGITGSSRGNYFRDNVLRGQTPTLDPGAADKL